MKPRVLIAGGGFTGLTAAYRLTRSRDCDVTIVEKSPTLGGLAGGFRLGGHPLEKTYHHLFRTDTDILRLVEEIGLGARLQWHPSSMAIYHGGRIHPFMTPRDVLRFAPLPFFSRVRLGAVVFFLQRYRNWRKLAGHTARAWMRRMSGPHAARVIWDPLLRGKFAGFADRVSMAWLWARIHIRANSRDPSGGGERLGYFDGGFEIITVRLAELVRAAGVSIHTDCAVQRLQLHDGRWRVRLGPGGEEQMFDRILFTGSTRAFARLLEHSTLGPPAYLEQLRNIPYLGAACLIFSYPESLGDAYWMNVNEAGAPFLVFINHTRLIPRERYGGAHVYYIGAYLGHDDAQFNASDDALAARWFDYLRTMHPTFDAGRVVERHLFRFADAQHVVDPGYAQRIPALATPHAGLFLSNFAQVFPEDRGTNYAVREGERAAAALRTSLA